MSLRTRLSLVVGLLAISLAPLTGCGGADCGEGTFEEDGVCMPEIAADDACGSGTMLVDGQCVLDESGCGTDAVLDQESGQCEPAPDFCADGTTYDQGADKCIANTEVVCGTGTVANEEGVCEPALDDICGDKTAADENGRCVIAADACGTGEVLDPNSGDCVATDTYCSDTTAFDSDSGTCVPTADVCDTGTEFDDESGLCLPDACQTGDVLLNGVCVDPAEALADEADTTSAENDDPSLGGTANEVTVEPVGDMAVFTGTIDAPSDINSSGDVDQDVDVFTFDATAGQWFNLSVQSTGLPAPAFMVEGPEGFERFSPSGMAAARKIAIPRDGTYTITVLPESVLLTDGNVGPSGADDWDYVGALEQIDVPSPTTVDISADDLTGSFADLGDNLYSIDGVSAGDIVDLTIDTAGDDAEGVLQVWAAADDFRGETEIDEGDELSYIVPETDTLLVLIDWKTAIGPNLDFSISGEFNTDFESIGQIGNDATVSSTAIDLVDGDTYLYTFSVGAGQVIEFTHDNDEEEEYDILLKNPAGDVLLDETFLDPLSADNTNYEYWYTESGGTFSLEITARGDMTNEVVTINTATPNDLGSVGIGDDIDATVTTALEEGQSEFHFLTATDVVRANGTLTANGGNSLDGAVWNTGSEELVGFTAGDPLEIVDYDFAPADTYLIRVEADDAGITEYTVDLTFAEAPPLEIEPNDTIQTATPWDPAGNDLEGTLSTPDIDVYSFSPPSDLGAKETFIIDVRQELDQSDEFSCRLEDDSGTILHENGDEAHEDGCTVFSGGLMSANTYYLIIERNFGSGDDAYTLTGRTVDGVTETEPNDDQSGANTIDFADITAGVPVYGGLYDNPQDDFFTFNIASDRDPNEVVTFTLDRIGSNPMLATGGEIELISATDGSLDIGDLDEGVSATGLTADDYFIRISRTGGFYWQTLDYGLTADATVPVCGNGTVEAGEECDDGNTSNGDGCDDSCEVEPFELTASSNITVTGALETSDPTFNRVTESCTSSFSATNVYFDEHEFTNNSGGDVTIDVTATWDFDGYLNIFSTPFDSTSPEASCLDANDDFNGTGQSQVTSLTVADGETITVVATSFSDLVTGDYTLDVVSQ